MIRHRPATRADMFAFWGHGPPYTVKFMQTVVDDNDEPLAIGGVAFNGDVVSIWMEWHEEALKYPIALVKACLASMQAARESGCRLLFAVAKGPAAERFLKHIGMEHWDSTPEGEIYQWRG